MNAATLGHPAHEVAHAPAVAHPGGTRFPLTDRRTYLATAHVVCDLWVGIVTSVVVIVGLSVTFSLAITVVFAVPFAWLTVTMVRAMARIERARARTFLGLDVADPVRPRTGGWWSRLRSDVTSGTTWRAIGYHLLMLPAGVTGWTLAVVTWSGSLYLITLPLWLQAMPDGSADLWLFEISGWGSAIAALFGAVGVVWVAPWTVRGWARVDAAMVRGLLGPNVNRELAARVETLSTTRALAVDAAEEERRRIERDLHDGAQQRLVALAIELGMARAKFDTDPEAARALLEEAHADAITAIAELRDLARGIHPVALTDRGLPGAIPGLAARSPIPIDVLVDVVDRPVPAIEGIAYFVVSEALTNIVKHANATRGRVTVRRTGDRLAVEVVDDGRGGAVMTAGSGLRGLADRVAAVDGSFVVESPVGGPTHLRVSLPCVLDRKVAS